MTVCYKGVGLRKGEVAYGMFRLRAEYGEQTGMSAP